MRLVNLPTWKPWKSTIHVCKNTIVPWILWERINCQTSWLFQSVSGSYWTGIKIKSHVCFDTPWSLSIPINWNGWQISPKRVFGFSWISFCFNTICFTFWFIFPPSYTVVSITIRRILLKCSKHLEKTYVPMNFSMDTKNCYIFSQESPEFPKAPFLAFRRSEKTHLSWPTEKTLGIRPGSTSENGFMEPINTMRWKEVIGNPNHLRIWCLGIVTFVRRLRVTDCRRTSWPIQLVYL